VITVTSVPETRNVCSNAQNKREIQQEEKERKSFSSSPCPTAAQQYIAIYKLRKKRRNHTHTQHLKLVSIRRSTINKMNPTFTNTGAMDKAVLRRYLDLPQPDNKVMATYIWIDGTGENVRGNIFLEGNMIGLTSLFLLNS
jgi:hypothetical protein